MSDRKRKLRVLCVDDEPDLLDGLKLQMRRIARVEVATSGAAGLECLEAGPPYDVVISDMRMPKMNGAEFLAKARAGWPETERILLTGQADLESAVSAVNEGGVFRFLTKPCPKERLVEAVEAAAETARLRHVERELIEGTLRGALGIVSEILAIVSPPAFQRSTRVETIVRQLASALALPEPWRFQVAATLSQLGCVAVPSEIIDRAGVEDGLDAKERALFDRHPEIAHELISRIPRLEEVAEMVRLQLAPTDLDPESEPSDWNVEQAGAELLRAASAVDALVTRGETLSASIGHLRKAASHPSRILDVLEQVELDAPDRVRLQIEASEIRAGMTLDEDAESRDGVVVARRGTEITTMIAQRLRNFAANAGLKEPIAVWVNADGEDA